MEAVIYVEEYPNTHFDASKDDGSDVLSSTSSTSLKEFPAENVDAVSRENEEFALRWTRTHKTRRWRS